MAVGFSRRKPVRHRRCRRYRSGLPMCKRLVWAYHPTVLMLTVAILLSGSLIGIMERRLRPVLVTAARVQTQNAVTVIAEEAILKELEYRSQGYTELVHIERDLDGSITGITTDMAAMNRLRSALIDAMVAQVSLIDEETIAIPVGSLVDSELIWGRGPTIKVRSFAVGSVSAEFHSEFISAGVNQTLHKIWLELSVPTTVLLPGLQLEIPVQTSLCVAETVIVGKVPSYLQKTYG